MLLLAAGRGRRFGSDKRRYPIDGIPMLEKTTALYRDVFDDVRVVIRPGDPELSANLTDLGAAVIEAADADEGQSRTLAAGIESLTDESHAIVALGDMPFVQPATLRSLRDWPADAVIVRPRFRDRPGNPIRFSAELFGALTAIEGDQGARDIIRTNPQRVAYLDTDDQGIIKDVDRPLNSAD